MAEGNKKLRLLYLYKILMEQTDEQHSMTLQDITKELKAYGIDVERKTFYADIEALRTFGVDIIGTQESRTYYYHIGNRQFELAELKLLVDSVQSAKFITKKKSQKLIKKIADMASQHEARQLQRQVYVTGRIKVENEGIYYNVDKLHTAIASNVMITFQYFQWNVEKKQVLRHGGKIYKVSPWALSWDDENYYLVAYDSEEETIKHYRVDKMVGIEITRDRRQGKEHFEQFDMASYAKKMFGMYHGDEQTVHMRFVNEFAGVVIDRFGKDVSMVKVDDDHFEVRVDVAVSHQFLGWIIALGDNVEILGPESVVNQMKEIGQNLVKRYN